MQKATKQYQSMCNKAENGEITEQHWLDFCLTLLEQMLDDCSDILLSLK